MSDNSKKDNVVMKFNKEDFARLVISDLSKTSSGRRVIKKHTQSEVREMVENYQTVFNQDKLVDISKTLYVRSQQYKRLIQYFSDMALFSYVLTPVKNIDKFTESRVRKQFSDLGELVDKMELKHEMRKVLRVAFVEDVFFGYIHEEKDSFYIQKIDHSICHITSIEDGVYNFSIDMTYFQRNPDELKLWADEVQIKYKQWESSVQSREGNFVELSPERTICIKINEEILERVPPFAGTFDSIFDIDAFKRLRKNKEEMGNYMVLIQKLPIRKDTNDVNDFLIDHDMFQYFHNMTSSTAPDNVGVITSPMEIEAVRFDKDSADSDGVAKAERDFWAGSGTSQSLFSVDKNTSQGIALSIKADEEIVFSALSQIQRWINRYISSKFKNPLFKVKILDLTYFNQEKMFDHYIEAGNNGFPVVGYIGAVIGMSPNELVGMAHLENKILNLHDNLIPLATSHTQSKDDKGGRPEMDDDDISDEGAKSRDKK